MYSGRAGSGTSAPETASVLPAALARFWHAPPAVSSFGEDPGSVRVLPDAAMDLVYSNGALRVAGADTSAKTAPVVPGLGTWGVRFGPGMMHALLRVNAYELTDRRAALDEILPVPPRIHDALAQDPADGMRLVIAELWRRTDQHRERLRLAASIDRAAKAGMGVRDIAHTHNLSERSLRRFSDRTFGYGVKTLASIHRFQRARSLGAAGTRAVDVALLAGYSDQAHLIRETRRFAGVTFRTLTQAPSAEDYLEQEEGRSPAATRSAQA